MDGPSENPPMKADTFRKDYETLKFLGKGSYGKVHQLKRKSDGQLLAMKDVNKKDMSNEKVILERLNHPFVIHLVDSFEIKTKMFFIMEYCSGGNLRQLLRRETNSEEMPTMFYVGQITLALEYLHSSHILYCDLKLDNTMLDGHGYVKLVDFGLSLPNIPAGSVAKGQHGTLIYQAPETISKQELGQPADIWALGVLMSTLVEGLYPFNGEDRDEKISEILYGKIPEPKNLSSDGQNLLKRILVRTPENRISIDGIKRHIIFKLVNWEMMIARKYKPPFNPAAVVETHSGQKK